VTGGGLVGLFAAHRTAANLLLAVMILAGLVAIGRINTQFFPDLGFDVVSVRVAWPGATAADVDANVIEALEPELRFLDGVRELSSTAYEGLALLSVEFQTSHDMQQALSDVEQAVAQVTTLPRDAERPEIQRLTRYDTVLRLVLSGPYGERALKRHAERIRDELLAGGIERVELFGARDEEIRVEVDPMALRRLDLTLEDIAERIGATSQDLPSGMLASGERQVRTLGLRRDAAAVAAIEIKAFPDGRKVRLDQLATVSEAFEHGGRTARRRGQPAIELHVQRATGADAIDQAELALAYLGTIAPTLPANLALETYDVQSDYIAERIGLLLRNGAGGLALVMLLLFVFLNGRVAFWVAVGIPAALLATVALMWLSGQSLNTMSLFGLIMAVGIVVDDAIVVGEHAETLHDEQGLAPLQAAIGGARRMLAPVMSATLTTIAAFMPLFLIGGVMGQVISALPFVILAVLTASVLECFLVLPAHLRGALAASDAAPGRMARLRRAFDARFVHLRETRYRRFVRTCIEWRYVTLAAAAAALVLAAGLIAGGQVPFRFFPGPEPDRVYANVQMAPGTSRALTERMIDEVERAAHAAAAALTGTADPTEPLVRMSLARIGAPVSGTSDGAATDTVGGVVVELAPADRRTVRSAEFVRAWRAEVRAVPGLEDLVIRGARGGPPGRDLDVRLSGGDIETLKSASLEVQVLMRRYPALGDIEDDLPYGRPETILEVTPRGRALGFDTERVGRQVRGAIEGLIADRFARGEDEVTVRVQYPRAAADAGLLQALYLRAPDGAEVPLASVARMRESLGFARIKREDGQRRIAISADIDVPGTNTGAMVEALLRDGLVDIARRHDLRYDFGGRAEEQAETFADMRIGASVGLAMIYVILAWVFASYVRPLVVMCIIPVGLVGAVLGHWLLGYELTILSLFALIGLSGIVINDSIILVTTIDARRRTQPILDAIVDGSCDRFRAVLLTSTTTIGGLAPLMFERSLQAQFLVPMAVTIVFGLALATVLVLAVVPALVAVQEDVRAWLMPAAPAAGRT